LIVAIFASLYGVTRKIIRLHQQDRVPLVTSCKIKNVFRLMQT